MLERKNNALVSNDKKGYFENKSNRSFQSNVLEKLEKLGEENKMLSDKLNHVLNLLHNLTQEK